MTEISIPPYLPYSCGVSWWQTSSEWLFYKTIKTTETAKITSARLKFRFQVPYSTTSDIRITLNGQEVYRTPITFVGGTLEETVDISNWIKPPVGAVAEQTNELKLWIYNMNFPFADYVVTIEKLSFDLTTTAELPPPSETETQQSGRGILGSENLDPLLSALLEMMFMFMLMSIMMSLMTSMTESIRSKGQG
jgi:hypothetical protein